jgi:hypothetical protein
VRRNLPRPTLFCTGTYRLTAGAVTRHSFVLTYGRPWWAFFRKVYRNICLHCPEELYAGTYSKAEKRTAERWVHN